VAGRPVAGVEHTPELRGEPAMTELLDRLTADGARLVRLTADEHDRLTAVAQSLTHVSVLAFGDAASRLGVDIGALLAVAPPPLAMLLSLANRIGTAVPEVYWDIQTGNPHAAVARDQLAASLARLSRLISDGDEAGFTELLTGQAAGLAGTLVLGSVFDAAAAALAGPPNRDQTADRADNWVTKRIAGTSDSLRRAMSEGLTAHTVVEHDGKTVLLGDGSRAVEFVSCSYLGLEQHPALIEAAHRAIDDIGVHFSSARNRMRPTALDDLEAALGTMYGGRSVTCFTSTTNVHLGVLPLLGAGALPSYPVGAGGVRFLVERTAHASMQVLRGILGQIGEVQRFGLHRPGDLAQRLALACAGQVTPIVLVDGVGSMGGLIDLPLILDEVAEAEGYLYVDDAHGISVFGERGAGYAWEAFGSDLPDRVVLAGSMSKAFGGAGGFGVLRRLADADVLRRLAHTLIFGGSIMLPHVHANLASARLHLDGSVTRLQQALGHNLAHFDERTGGRLVNAGHPAPIRGIAFDTEKRTLAVAGQLRRAGVLVIPAFFPTVAPGTGLIRFGVSSLHTPEQIDLAAEALKETW
jgi:7-keto-8-aminopelargonate synthetase-like enzyme